jgi:oxygen-independent coproporphyrinogen III oxidase
MINLNTIQKNPNLHNTVYENFHKSTNNKPIHAEITPAIINQFDVAGPRYTSYPTADRFVEAFNATEYQLGLTRRRSNPLTSALSMYIHIPFCESLCFFCACNKIVTKHHERSREYLHYLKKEIRLHLLLLGEKNTLSQLHLGGGSPTFFNDEELNELITHLKEHFKFTDDGEYAIEVDPRTVDEVRIKHLSEMGFNRISFGVQDFDHDVQKAVHRVQATEQVFSLVEAARKHQFKSVNVDLIYGLPKQTINTFNTTLNKIISLKPDRIALYAYAHLPERFKPQRRILASDLPSGHEKITMLSNAIQSLLDAGYVYVGMDHFALPEDALAVAKRQGRLHRNFQGYSTQADCDLISLGVSAIGKIGANYSQNSKTIEEYYDLLDQGNFPVVRGLALSHDDLVRRAVIMALMCQGEVEFEAIELAYIIDFNKYFANELKALKGSEFSEMVTINQSSIVVSEIGWFFVRAIAMQFDRYLQTDKNRATFSKII